MNHRFKKKIIMEQDKVIIDRAKLEGLEKILEQANRKVEELIEEMEKDDSVFIIAMDVFSGKKLVWNKSNKVVQSLVDDIKEKKRLLNLYEEKFIEDAKKINTLKNDIQIIDKSPRPIFSDDALEWIIPLIPSIIYPVVAIIFALWIILK